MTTDTMPLSLAERVSALVEQTVAGTPVYVVEVVVRGRAGSRVLDVYLDSDAAIGVDELAGFSRQLALLLDADDVVPGSYRLNVSTPGLDRPLIPRQWPKHVGRKIQIAVVTDDGEARLDGVLQSADPEGLVLLDSDGVENRLTVEIIKEVKVLLPW